MQLRTSLGIVITVIGIVMTVYTGYRYVTRPEDTTEIIASQKNKEDEHCIKWFPIVGTAMLVCGIVIIIKNKRIGEV